MGWRTVGSYSSYKTPLEKSLPLLMPRTPVHLSAPASSHWLSAWSPVSSPARP